MLDPTVRGRSAAAPAAYQRPGQEPAAQTKSESPTSVADLRQGHQGTLKALRQLRDNWSNTLDGPSPSPTKPPTATATTTPSATNQASAAKYSGSENAQISRLESQGLATPEPGFQEPTQRGSAALAKTSNLAGEPKSTTQGGPDAKVTMKNTGRHQPEPETPTRTMPQVQSSLLRTVPIFQAMIGRSAAPQRAPEPSKPSPKDSSRSETPGTSKSNHPVQLSAPANLRNSRSLQGPLSGSLGKLDAPNLASGWDATRPAGEQKLANGRVVTAQIPVHSPILDQAQDLKMQAQRQARAEVNLQLHVKHQAVPQGRELAEFALRHAGHSIESLLKKAYRLDSRQKLSQPEALRFFTLILKVGGDFTFSHSSRVLDLAMDLADEVGVDAETRRNVEMGTFLKDSGEMALLLDQAPTEKLDQIGQWLSGQDLQKAGILHDIGKTQIPAEILYKPGKLTDEEYELMKLHPILGEKMLFPVKSLRHLCPIVRGHHERWDGQGYPDGLRGDQIPLGARIIAVADVFDALVAERPYKAGMPVEKVKAILLAGRGTHFDPDLSDAFGRVLQRRYPELGNPFE
jgi:HD-GYP domain-containing protein (c-di-GMP phosphodiesterase class II)